MDGPSPPRESLTGTWARVRRRIFALSIVARIPDPESWATQKNIASARAASGGSRLTAPGMEILSEPNDASIRAVP